MKKKFKPKTLMQAAIGILNRPLDDVPKINGKPYPKLKTLDQVLRVVSKQLWKEIQDAKAKTKRDR